MPSILDSLLGQSDVPQFNVPTLGQALRAIGPGKTDMMADINNRFNEAMMPRQMATMLGAEALFDPGIAALRGDTTKAIADQLALGGSIPPDMLAMLLQAGFERGSLTGMGNSGAGRNLVARDLGLTSLDLLRKRIEQAGDWTRSSPLPGQLYSPINDITPGGGMSYDAARTNANNAFQQYANQIRNQNTMNLIDRPVGIGSTAAGTILGAMFGTSGMGSMLGGGGGGGGGIGALTSAYGANNPGMFTPTAPIATSAYGVPIRG